VTSWLRRSTFQARLSVLIALAVGVAVALAAMASFYAVKHQLYAHVRTTLQQTAVQIQNGTPTAQIDQGGGGMVAEVYVRGRDAAITTSRDGDASPSDNLPILPRTNAQLALIGQGPTQVLYGTWTDNGVSYHTVTAPVQISGAFEGTQIPINAPGIVVVGYNMSPVLKTLATLRVVLLLVAAGGVLLAVGLGGLIAEATIRPVKRLTAAAEHVAETQELDATITEDSEDELGRLAHAFNDMLGALSASRQQQAQLVSDAGHELRTPLTSLRTNVELLVRARNLPEADRADLQQDVIAQLEELTTLIGDLVELARQDEQQPEPTEVRLDDLVHRAVERAKRRAPSLHFDLHLTAGSVKAHPPLLERALLNVLDNAAKWSPPGGTVKVDLSRTDHWTLEVRDHGPGIAPDDVPKVFDRFYRAPSARSMPGSGLGLAIVRQVVTSHGGSVEIDLPADGGTLLRIRLPIVAEQEPPAAGPTLPPRPTEPPPAPQPAPDPWTAAAGGDGSGTTDEPSPWAPEPDPQPAHRNGWSG